MPNYLDNYNRWLNSDKLSDAERAELLSIKDDDKEIQLRFTDYLSFGTAGLRGTMKVGMNAMNVHTVAYATQGLAQLIIEEGRTADGVAIAYDWLYDYLTAEQKQIAEKALYDYGLEEALYQFSINSMFVTNLNNWNYVCNGGFITTDGSGDESGYDYNTWGATVGANLDLTANTVVGLSFSASYGEISVDSTDHAKGNNDAEYISFFARHQKERWVQMLILTAGMNDMDLERRVLGYTAEGFAKGGVKTLSSCFFFCATRN